MRNATGFEYSAVLAEAMNPTSSAKYGAIIATIGCHICSASGKAPPGYKAMTNFKGGQLTVHVRGRADSPNAVDLEYRPDLNRLRPMQQSTTTFSADDYAAPGFLYSTNGLQRIEEEGIKQYGQ